MVLTYKLIMEIQREEVIRLILQFCQENGFIKTIETLQNESEVALNIVPSKAQLQKDIVDGKWDLVLKSIKLFKLTSSVLLDLYEIIICELVEVNETQVAHQFFTAYVAQQFQDEKERMLRLDYLIRKPGKLDINEIYLDNYTKEQRRADMAKKILDQCIESKPMKLMDLLGDGLRFRVANRMISKAPKYSFFDPTQEMLEKPLNIVGSIEKVVKYSEKMRANCAVYVPTGEHVVLGTVDGIIEVWDAQKLAVDKDLEYQQKELFMMHKEGTCIIDLSCSDDLLASLDSQSHVKVWNMKQGKCLKFLDNTHTKPVSCLLLSRDNAFVYTAAEVIHQFGLKSGTVHKQFRGHDGAVNHMLQSEEGSRIYSCSSDKTVRVWDVHTGEQTFVFKCDSVVLRLARVDAQQFVVCAEGKLHQTNQFLSEVRQIKVEGQFVSCGTSREYIYGLSEKSTIYVYSASSGKALKAYKLPGQRILGVLHNPRRAQLFCYASSGELMFIRD